MKLNRAKKLLSCGILAVMMAACSAAMAAVPIGEGVIPYPPGLDITSAGASAVPAETNHFNSEYFRHPDVYNMTSNDHLTILGHYPVYQQTTEYTCGSAAALTVLYYYGNYDYDEMSLAKGMKTQGFPIGTSPENMVKFFENIGWEVESSLSSKPLESEKEFPGFVLDKLRQGIPIMVENVEIGGHWRVIIGYDTMGTDTFLDDVLIMADPYDYADHWQDGYGVTDANLFYWMWFDHNMLPKKQRTQPWIAAHPPAK